MSDGFTSSVKGLVGVQISPAALMLKAKDVILKDNKLYIDADAIVKSIKEHTAVASFLIFEIEDLRYKLKLTSNKPEEKEEEGPDDIH